MNRQEPPAPLTKVKTEVDETYDRAGGNESTGQGLVEVVFSGRLGGIRGFVFPYALYGADQFGDC